MPDTAKKRVSPTFSQAKTGKSIAEPAEQPSVIEECPVAESEENAFSESVAAPQPEPVKEPLKDIMKNEPLLLNLIIKSYEGEYDEDGFFEGEGMVYLHGDMKYKSSFNRGKMHGYGKFEWGDGTTYSGHFLEGELNGQGIYNWPDGSTYEGDVKNGFRDGFGNFKCSGHLKSYSGQWKNSKRHGKGIMYYDDTGNSYYDGDWVEGNKEGYGVRRFPNGNMYEGHWKNNARNGQGTMYWYNLGQEYTGEWVDGVQCGKGENIWYLKRIDTSQYLLRNHYYGDFVNGERDGWGCFYYANGAMYEGEWKRNVKHGRGTFTFKNGSVFKGQFRNDRIQEFPNLILSGMGTPDIISNQIPVEYPVQRTSKPSSLKEELSTEETFGPERSKSVLSTSVVAFIDTDLESLLQSLKCDIDEQEEEAKTLVHVILRYITELKNIYKLYSCLGVTSSVDNTFVMNMLQFCRFLKDHKIHQYEFSLVEIINCIGFQDDLDTCFGKVFMRDFLAYLIKIGYLLFRSFYEEEQKIISKSFQKIVEIICCTNDIRISGYIYKSTEQAKCFAKYSEKCLEIYFYFCDVFTKRERKNFTAKDVLQIFKELNLLNEIFSSKFLVNIIVREDKDEDGFYNLGKEVCPFEFLEILCGSALVFISEEILHKFHPVEEGEYSEVLPVVEFSPSKSMEDIEDNQKMNEEQVEEMSENSGRKNSEGEASKPQAIDSYSTTDKSPNKTLSNQKLPSKISRKMKHDTTKKVEKENAVLLQTVKSKEKKENSGKVEKKRSSLKNEDSKSKSPSFTKKDVSPADSNVMKETSEANSISGHLVTSNISQSNGESTEQVNTSSDVAQKNGMENIDSVAQCNQNVTEKNDLAELSSDVEDDFERWSVKLNLFFNNYLFPAFDRRKEVDSIIRSRNCYIETIE